MKTKENNKPTHIDVKYTIWERIHLNEDADLEKIVKTIEEYGADGIAEEDGFNENEILYDTTEELSIKDNKGDPTVEIFTDDIETTARNRKIYISKCIWDNVNKFNQE